MTLFFSGICNLGSCSDRLCFEEPLNIIDNSATFKIDFRGDLHVNYRVQCDNDRMKESVHLDCAAKPLEKLTG